MDITELRSLALFDGLADDELEACAERFEEAEILAGSALTREGDFSHSFFVVLEGEVIVLRDFDEIARLGPGDFFGETGLLSGDRRNARVVADTRTRVAKAMAWDFSDMRKEVPQFAARVEAVIAERSAPADEG